MFDKQQKAIKINAKFYIDEKYNKTKVFF